jgi:hypothetical protein
MTEEIITRELIARVLTGMTCHMRAALIRLRHVGPSGLGCEAGIPITVLRALVTRGLATEHVGPADHPAEWSFTITPLGRKLASVALERAQRGDEDTGVIGQLILAGVLPAPKPVETPEPPPSGVVAKAVAPAPRASGVRAR